MRAERRRCPQRARITLVRPGVPCSCGGQGKEKVLLLLTFPTVFVSRNKTAKGARFFKDLSVVDMQY